MRLATTLLLTLFAGLLLFAPWTEAHRTLQRSVPLAMASLAGTNDFSIAGEKLAYSRGPVPINKPMSIVPLKNAQNALMVDATLFNHRTGQSMTGTFIIDTGATYTSISHDAAEALGLDLDNSQSIRITTANGRIDVPKVRIDRVNVSGLEARDVDVTVIPLRKGSSFHGLLGLSFIRQFRLTIDPQRNQLIFQPN